MYYFLRQFPLNQFIKPKQSWIASKINSINLVSPNEKNIIINFKKETGYILNRKVFDYDLSNIAVNAGADVYTKAYNDTIKRAGSVYTASYKLIDETIDDIKKMSRKVSTSDYSANNVYIILQDAFKKVRLAEN